jgi:MFS family permease
VEAADSQPSSREPTIVNPDRDWRSTVNRPSAQPSWPWILASVAGFAIGGAIAGGVVLAGELALVDTAQSPADAAAALALVTAVSLGLVGATVGVLQWLVLRRWLPASGWWIAATTGGWAAAGALAGTLAGFLGGAVPGVGSGIGVLGFLVSFVGSAIAIGLLPGVLQSVVLRHRVGALAWTVAHLTALGPGVLVAFPVMLVVAPLFGFRLPSAPAWALAGLLVGTVFGTVTWRVLERTSAGDAEPRASLVRPGGATG